MPSLKECKCVVCGEEDEKKFQAAGHKSLCKKHIKVEKTPDMRKLILKPYDCRWCHDKDESKYHVYCKTKCKKHFNGIKHKKKQIVVISSIK